MTKAEQILTVVSNLYSERNLEKNSAGSSAGNSAGRKDFSQDIIRAKLGLSHKMWHAGYSNTFQAMCINCGKGIALRKAYKNVFKRVCHGSYQLSDYGMTLLKTSS